MAQSVARILGKDEVTGSNPVSSSNTPENVLFSGAFRGFSCVPQASSFFATILGRDEAYYGTMKLRWFSQYTPHKDAAQNL